MVMCEMDSVWDLYSNTPLIYLRYDNNVKELSVCVCYNIVSEILECCFRIEYIKQTYFAKVATSDILKH